MNRRRDEGLLFMLAAMPWPAGIVAGVMAFLFFRYGIGAILAGSTNPTLDAMGRLAAAGGFRWIAWTFLGLCWLAALLSYIKRRHRARLLDTQSGLDSVRDMDWRRFEMLVGEAFRRQGFSVTENGLGGADGGIDLVLEKEGSTHLVQCKQWRKQRVDVHVVREMFGLMTHHRAQSVIIVSVGEFTAAARQFAQGKPVELIHGERLLSMIRDAQIQASANAPAEAHATVSTTPAHAERANRSAPLSSAVPVCPRCGADMKQRANRNTGHAFWGCPAYPSCRGTRPIG